MGLGFNAQGSIRQAGAVGSRPDGLPRPGTGVLAGCSVGAGQRPDSGAYPPRPRLTPTPTPARPRRPTLGGQSPHSTRGRGWGTQGNRIRPCSWPGKKLSLPPSGAEGKNRREEEPPDGPLALARPGGAGGGRFWAVGGSAHRGSSLRHFTAPRGEGLFSPSSWVWCVHPHPQEGICFPS